jgi:predicted S18 family serine protease
VYSKITTTLLAYLTLILITPSWLSTLITTQRYFTCRVQLLAISGNRGLLIPGEISISTGGTGAILSTGVSRDVLASFKLALIYASITTGVDYKSYNYYLKIDGDVKGLSATLLFYVVLSDMLGKGTCPQSISATGVIGPGGVIGAVGGLEQKLEAAAAENISLIYAPGVQRDVFNYTPISVRGVYTVYDLGYLQRGEEYSDVYLLINSTQLLFKPVYMNLSSTASAVLSELEALNWSSEYTNNALEKLREASLAAEQGKYYVAASLAYSALVNAYISRLLYAYESRSGDILEILNETASRVLITASSTKSEITNLLEWAAEDGLIDPVYFDVLITAYARISEAEKYARTAINLIENVGALITSIAVAEARTLSAYGWLIVANSTRSALNRLVNVSNTVYLSRLAREFLSEHLEYLSLLGLATSSNLTETGSVSDLLEVFSTLLDASRSIYSPSNAVFIPTSREVVKTLVKSLKSVVVNYTALYSYVPLSTLLVLDLAEYYLNISVDPSDVISLVYSELPRVALYAYMSIAGVHEAAPKGYLELQLRVPVIVSVAVGVVLVSVILVYYLRKRSRVVHPVA